MKIVLSGIFYPVAILRYFEQALRRRSDVELFTVGPYVGTWIPWNGGMHLKAEYALPEPDLILPRHTEQTKVPASFIEKRLPWSPDLWLQIDSTYHWQSKSTIGKTFTVATDPHCINYDLPRSYSDKLFCMQTPYMKDGDIWLPYAYDPVWHRYIQPEEHTYQYDFGIIGALYENRTRLVNALRSAGFSVYAPGFGVVYKEAREQYALCRSGLNYSSEKDLCARVFELAAMGLCPVVNRVPDLEKIGFREGVSYFGFDNVAQGVAAAVKAADCWKQIGYGAHLWIQDGKHTWDDRVETILSYM